MKLASFLMLSAVLTLGACSHHQKGACCSKEASAESCPKDGQKAACCDKDNKCTNESCAKKKQS